ncbi:uncharacterized protein LOC120943018 [Rana temporaria]|uniref:uncharacterized protein LOC120943018 n=1 Tax=Rana temporaria TaxID=8407 RepID=UPI001AAC4F7F|nr:uncharacterized protein LOC120943018 [Rana temporaria]
MENSTPTSLNMKKQFIIAGHLKKLSEISWKQFKLSLCKKKPSGKGEGIKMGDIKDKSVEDVVELIFKCYTQRLGPGTITKILTDLKENDMRTSIQRDIREASKVLKDMKVHSVDSNIAIPSTDIVSSSEPPAKIIRQQDGDAPGQSQRIEKNVNEERELKTLKQLKRKKASKVLKDMKVHSVGSNSARPNNDTVSSSEPPAKKIGPQDGDAPGQSRRIKKTFIKMRELKTFLKQLNKKKGKSLKIQQSMNKNEGPKNEGPKPAKPAKKQPKQEMAALSELVRNPARFFEEVEARPALFDRNNPHNCDKEVKKKLWEEVASKVIKDWEQLDPKDKEEIINSLPTKWRNFAGSFQREYKKQVGESKSDPGPSKMPKYRYYEQLIFLLPTMDQRQTTFSQDGKQDDVQQDCLTGKQAEKSEQGLQTVSESFPQKNMSPEMDEDSYFLLSFMKKIGEIPPENKPQLKIEIINIFEKYSKPIVPHNEDTVTTTPSHTFLLALPVANNPDSYPLLGSNPRIPSSSQSSPYMSSPYPVLNAACESGIRF